MFKRSLYLTFVFCGAQASELCNEGLIFEGERNPSFMMHLRAENATLSAKDLKAKKTGASILKAQNLTELKAALEEAKAQKHPVFQSDDCQKLIAVKILKAVEQEAQ